MFTLDKRLAGDTVPVGRFDLSLLLLMNDSRYPWCILVPQREGISEIHQLSADDQAQLIRESSAVSEVLNRLFHADKMNVAALGNIVPQLHLHHIARHHNDPAWPGPVWGHSNAVPYPGDELAARITLLRQHLPQLQTA